MSLLERIQAEEEFERLETMHLDYPDRAYQLIKRMTGDEDKAADFRAKILLQREMADEMNRTAGL